jgi:selenocysteine-specific elongation factor
VARAGDRFILRLESPLETLGGGEVIDPAPPRHRRRAKKDAAARLARLRQATLEEEVLIWLELVGAAGLQVDQLARRSRRSQEQLRGALLQAEAREQAVALDQDKREFVDPEVVEAGVESLLQALQQYHHRHPLRSGATRGELRDMLPWYAERVFLKTLEKAVAAGSLTADGALFRRTEFEVRLSESEQALADSLIDLLEKAEFSPPLTSELQESLKSDEARLVAILGVLGRRGLVRKIKEGHWMSATALDRLQGVIVDHLRSAGELTPTQFKELTGLSRKWAIPLLEYFDKIQLTLRVGDVRRLRGG